MPKTAKIFLATLDDVALEAQGCIVVENFDAFTMDVVRFEIPRILHGPVLVVQGPIAYALGITHVTFKHQTSTLVNFSCLFGGARPLGFDFFLSGVSLIGPARVALRAKFGSIGSLHRAIIGLHHH
jgi:hypothetical protein